MSSMDKYDIAALTKEEIESLQVDAALRTMGAIDSALREVTIEMYEATTKYYDAKRDLDQLKHIKKTLVERARNLKHIVNSA